MKTAKQMEKHFKGIANHRRIEVLLLLSQQSDLSLDAIAKELKVNFQTLSEHVLRLHHAGLVDKRHAGREVHHSLSPYGKKVVAFVKSFQRL